MYICSCNTMSMKRIVLLLLIIGINSTSQAQKLKFGFENSLVLYGATTDNNAVTSSDQVYQAPAGGLMPSYRTGLTFQYPVLKQLGVESGILVDLMGYRFSQPANAFLGEYKGNVLSFSLKVPLLAYYKILMSSGGSLFFGGGMNFNYAFSGLYKYRIDGKLHNYNAIQEFPENVNQFSMGYQVVLGIEDSEFSQFRLSYGSNFDSYTKKGINDIIPFYLAFSFIARIN